MQSGALAVTSIVSPIHSPTNAASCSSDAHTAHTSTTPATKQQACFDYAEIRIFGRSAAASLLSDFAMQVVPTPPSDCYVFSIEEPYGWRHDSSVLPVHPKPLPQNSTPRRPAGTSRTASLWYALQQTIAASSRSGVLLTSLTRNHSGTSSLPLYSRTAHYEFMSTPGIPVHGRIARLCDQLGIKWSPRADLLLSRAMLDMQQREQHVIMGGLSTDDTYAMEGADVGMSSTFPAITGILTEAEDEDVSRGLCEPPLAADPLEPSIPSQRFNPGHCADNTTTFLPLTTDDVASAERHPLPGHEDGNDRHCTSAAVPGLLPFTSSCSVETPDEAPTLQDIPPANAASEREGNVSLLTSFETSTLLHTNESREYSLAYTPGLDVLGLDAVESRSVHPTENGNIDPVACGEGGSGVLCEENTNAFVHVKSEEEQVVQNATVSQASPRRSFDLADILLGDSRCRTSGSARVSTQVSYGARLGGYDMVLSGKGPPSLGTSCKENDEEGANDVSAGSVCDERETSQGGDEFDGREMMCNDGQEHFSLDSLGDGSESFSKAEARAPKVEPIMSAVRASSTSGAASANRSCRTNSRFSSGRSGSGASKMAGKGTKSVWTCEQCGVKIRGKKGNLNRHYANKHENIRPFVCKIATCRRRFQTRLNLLRHERAVHTGRPFVCPHCPRNFKNGDSLNVHVRTAHESTEHEMACEMCGSCFARRSTLNRHRVKVHKEKMGVRHMTPASLLSDSGVGVVLGPVGAAGAIAVADMIGMASGVGPGMAASATHTTAANSAFT